MRRRQAGGSVHVHARGSECSRLLLTSVGVLKVDGLVFSESELAPEANIQPKSIYLGNSLSEAAQPPG